MNPDSLIGNDVNRSACASKTMSFVIAQVDFMMTAGNAECLR